MKYGVTLLIVLGPETPETLYVSTRFLGAESDQILWDACNRLEMSHYMVDTDLSPEAIIDAMHLAIPYIVENKVSLCMVHTPEEPVEIKEGGMRIPIGKNILAKSMMDHGKKLSKVPVSMLEVTRMKEELQDAVVMCMALDVQARRSLDA